MHDRPGRPRSIGLAAALGAWVVAAADPALAAAPTPATSEPTPAEPAAAEASEPSPAEPETPEPETPAVTEPSPAEPPPETNAASEPAAAPKPPRIDGTYLGATLFAGMGLLRVNDLDTNGPFAAFGGTATIGQMVFPWLGLGLHGGGGGGVRSEEGARQRLGQGYLGVQLKFVPLAKRQLPLSLMTSFGFGGGAVRQAGLAQRSGFGGAQFGAAARYELFPFAKKRRPYRGGGLGLGPEVGWIGFTPAAPGRPMSNVIYVALSTTFYFGS